MKVIIKKKNNHRNRNIGIGLVVIFLVFAFILLKPQRDITPKEVEIKNYVENEVNRQQANIFVNQLSGDITHLAWRDSTHLTFYGTHETRGQGYFEVNSSDLTIESADSVVEDPDNVIYNDQVVADYTLLYEREDYQFYYFKDEGIRGLYKVMTDGSVYNISEHMALDSDLNPYVIMSANGDKLFYLEEETLRFVTYDFNTNKKKLVKFYCDETLLDALSDRIQFSPEGGFFSYRDSEDLLYVFGSDSGNVFVEGVEGVADSFNASGNTFFYLYKGAMSTAFSGTQLGIVNLSNGEINYDTASEGEYYSKLLTIKDSDAVYYFTGNVTNGHFLIENMIKFDPKTNEKTFMNQLTGVTLKASSDFDLSENLLIFHDLDNDLRIYFTESQHLITLSGLQSFAFEGDTKDYFKMPQGVICVYSGGVYKIMDQGKTLVYTLEKTLKELSIAPDFSQLAIIASDDEGVNFVITSKVSDEF